MTKYNILLYQEDVHVPLQTGTEPPTYLSLEDLPVPTFVKKVAKQNDIFKDMSWKVTSGFIEEEPSYIAAGTEAYGDFQACQRS